MHQQTKYCSFPGCHKIMSNKTHRLCKEHNEARILNHMAFQGIEIKEIEPEARGNSQSAFAVPISKKTQDQDILRDRFYLEVWKRDKHECFECGEPLPFYSRAFVHHLIEKREQKNYSCSLDDPENGILLCLLHHDQCRLDLDEVPKVKKLTEQLLQQYKQFKQK